MNRDANATIEVRFKTPEESGRRSNINGDMYACPMLIDNEYFDCRISLCGRQIELGCTYDLEVRFLSADLAGTHLVPGRAISLWEGKEIAVGTIKKVQ